ncbi:MAG: serine/threonine protein kinase, partial [Oscillospiraceae bacterium]|nr:serine/threonine protein kinase [Oscillospiraceae bacterium]
DFGTAKKYEFDSGETTGLGTAGFAAPEQYGGHGRTDARTDIFCLGMTMYALLTGIDPQKDFIPETSIRKVNPEFPPGLDQIIQKCTRKNPDERYQSCEELLYYLERYKEIDKSSRKKKVMKVSLFISCLAVSLISGVCGGLLHLQAQAMATDNYKELIDEANAITLTYSDDEDSEENEEYAQKIALYEQAIEVSGKAGDKNAYLGIFEAYLENDGYDAVFDEKEIEHMKKLMLNYKADLQANPEDYADVCYEIGELYWWYYYDDKNEIVRQQEAVKWFQRVIENTGEDYDAKKLELATAYSEIGSTLQELTALSTKGNVDDDTYKQLFDNIKNMVDEIGSSTNTRDIVHLEMLEMARVVLRQYVYDFKRVFMKDRENLPEKPGREKIVGLYKEIDRQLHTIDIDSYTEDTAVKKKYTEIEENMKETKEKIEEIYSIQIKGTEIS